MSHDIPHPLAGRTGDGAPFAPKDWKWKAGQRLSDMYFISPEGMRIRSQIQLQDYLSTLPNPPPFKDFCWRISPDEYKDGPLPGVLDTTKRRRRQAQAYDLPSQKKRKKKESPLLSPLKVQTDKTRIFPKISIPHKVIPFAPSNLLPGNKKKMEARSAGVLTHSFRSILSSASSYKWLYNENADFQQFMEEAGQLKMKSPAEMAEFRGLLLKRNLEVSNLVRYHAHVLRVFVSILRNEEPPASLGKIELASLCAEWRCKHKRYWCLLEVGQVQSPVHALQKVAVDPSGSPLVACQIQSPTDKLPKVAVPSSSSVLLCDQGGRNELDDLDPHQVVTMTTAIVLAEEGSVLHSSITVENLKPVESPPAALATTGILESTKKEDVLPMQAGEVAHDHKLSGHIEHVKAAVVVSESICPPMINKQVEDQGGPVNAQLANIGGGQGDERVSGEKARKETECGRQSQSISRLTRREFEQAGSTCFCKICIDDLSFCRGCMCSFCKVGSLPNEKWKVLECAACSHTCHFLCAYKAQQAGVSNKSGLDGEFQCPGCSKKSDLLNFWKKRLECAVSSIDLEEMEKQLSMAVLVLRDTERASYQPLQQKVMEAHKLVKERSSLSTEVYDVLQLIKEELDALGDVNSHLGQDGEWAREVLEGVQDINWLEEERKVIALQKQAKQEYEAWVRTEKVAEAQRTLLCQQIQRAETEAKEHAQRAASLSLQANNARHRLKVMKQVQASMGVTLEQVELQRAELQNATAALEQLQHDVAFFQAPAVEDTFPAFSALLEQLQAQREIVASARLRLDSMVSLHQSQ